jgi:peroxiredoxin
MKKILFALVLLIFVLHAEVSAQASKIEKVLGEKTVPSVTLIDIDGKKVNVAELTKNGKITVLSFWATWCIPCKKELSNMSDLYDEWKQKYDVQIVAISIDDSRSASKVKPYIDGQRWTYGVLLDVNQDLKRELNIQSVPFTLLVDQNGKIVSSHQGYQEGDENILEDQIAALKK